jgi:predicted N-acetyltransferase YhbS
MAIELRQCTSADVPALGQICFDAFKGIADEHGFESDFPSAEFSIAVMGLIVAQEDIYSVGAFDGGTALGSNHMELWDAVAGVGPVSVDPTQQGGGVGRKLMEDGMAHARSQGFDAIRLVQESFNMRSLALYASLGFDLKHPLAYMALSDAHGTADGFRPATAADADAMDALCTEIYRVSRRNEIASLMRVGFPVYVIERGDRVRGYLAGTAFGHGVAETDDVLMDLVNSVGASTPNAHAYVPLRSGDLYRRALAAGHRNKKVLNLMAYGPYEEPQGPWLPSVIY